MKRPSYRPPAAAPRTSVPGVLRPSLLLLVLIVAPLLGGCLSPSGTALSQLQLNARSFGVTESGDAVLELEARTADGEPAQVDELRVVGVSGGEAVELAEIVLDEESRAVEEPGTIRLSLDGASIAELDIEELHIFPSNQPNRPLVLPVRDGRVITEADDGPLAEEADIDPFIEDYLGAVTPQAVNSPAGSVTREIRILRRGTYQATRVYIIRSKNPGPTAMIVGGVHGSETAGWRAARIIANWKIDAGTLIVIPEANRDAIRRDHRTGRDGQDLNRQFPVGRRPTWPLAREIWNLVEEFQPDALLDLHEGWGLRRLGHRFPGGTLSVGQTLIAYPTGDAAEFARYVTAYQDLYHVKDRFHYSFMVIGPPLEGTLAHKAGRDLGIPAFIAEPSQQRTRLQTRIRWHLVFAEEFLRWYGLIDQGRSLVPKAYRVNEQLDLGVEPAVILPL